MGWRISYSALNANPFSKTILLVRRKALAMHLGNIARLCAAETAIKCCSWHIPDSGRLGFSYARANVCESVLKVVFSIFSHGDR